ncbi:unnamed protein product [Microthlaspi erraticum]|uniref:Protease Do-like PDZ domain-containing protein n=1 Tax=Microthlaspi erraticum TaxID=1685480 RepID=A0A6D2I540_9BRAS|nr:unnamed protein product [Microthlaspi erraticum]
MLFLPTVSSVPTVARYCTSSSTPVSRFLSSSPSLSLRSLNILLPTLSLAARNESRGFSSNHASTICHYSSSVSEQENTSPLRFDAAIESLVQIFHFSKPKHPLQPWDKSEDWEKREIDHGFAISGRRILVDSRTVYDHTSLRVRKFGSDTSYKAKVEAVVHEYGLATLVVDSEEFWEHTHALEFGDDIPSVGETVFVFNYVGDTIKLAQETVTSVEPREYFDGTNKLLAIEINNGSFYGCSHSGLVVMGNKIVGLYPGVHSYIIPTPVIKRFLNGLEDVQHIDGLGSLDIWHQTMEDAQLRRHFKMSRDMTGVLITKIDPLSNALKVLKEHDVLLAIEGLPVSNDGQVHFRGKEWLHFTDMVSKKKPGETAFVKILRDGKEHVFDVSLNFTVLSDDINKEYSHFKDYEVKKVNGVEVVNLKHLSELVEKCCTEDLRFDLEEGHVIVLNNLSAKEATPLILERHGIPSAISIDLQ